MGKKKASQSSAAAGNALKSQQTGKRERNKKKNATKKPALGEITHISLTPEQEDVILELLKTLDDDRTRVLRTRPVDSSRADTPSSSSQSSESEDDELESGTFVAEAHGSEEDPTEDEEAICKRSGGDGSAAVFSKPIHNAERKAMVRQLIRDHRRISNDTEYYKDAKKCAKKQFLVTGVHEPDGAGCGPFSDVVTDRVRLSVVFRDSSNNEIYTESIIIHRSEGIEELCRRCCFKFGVRRYAPFSLQVEGLRDSDGASVRSALTNESLESLSDGAILHLVSGRDNTDPQPTDTTDGAKLHCVDETDGHEWSPRAPDAALSEVMRNEMVSRARQPPENASLVDSRQRLPIFAMREALLSAARSNQVIVVAGDTGSGKSTQLPQYLFEDAVLSGRGSETFIICTQPRRLAAVSLADRVSEELAAGVVAAIVDSKGLPKPDVYKGDDMESKHAGCQVITASDSQGTGGFQRGLCGYEVRLKTNRSRATRILYCTTGILLRKLQSAEFLNCVSHVILDEVHERQVEMDFLCTILKSKIRDFPKLKLILMSATMREESIADYYNNCPILRIPGRMYPIQIRYNSEIPSFISRWGSRRFWPSETESDMVPCRDPTVMPLEKRSLSVDSDEALEGGIGFVGCDAVLIVSLIRSIVCKHYIENPFEYSCVSVDQKGGEDGQGQCILVFLPGIQDIRKVEMELKRRDYQYWLPSFSHVSEENPEVTAAVTEEPALNRDSSSIMVHILHSSLSLEQQKRVFRKTKQGRWKIILSTNIAETSVTIDDVTCVIDSGLEKLVVYDPVRHISTLVQQPISLSSARQRAGRAGRTRPGECWRLSPEEYWTGPLPELDGVPLESLNRSVVSKSRAVQNTSPEILRIPLEDIVLKVLKLKLGTPELFLRTCMDAPDVLSVRMAVSRLIDMGAIEPQAELPLTPLGRVLADLPMDALLGKMLLYSSILDCLDPVLTIVAYLSGKSPFQMSLHKRDENYKMYMQFALKDHPFSDHLAVLNVFNVWRSILEGRGRETAFQFCLENRLSFSAMEDIAQLRELFRENIARTGFSNGHGDASFTRARDENVLTKETVSLISCCLCAGLYPNVLRVCNMPIKKPNSNDRHGGPVRTETKMLQADGDEVNFHVSSLLHRQMYKILSDRKDGYVAYFQKMASSSPARSVDTIHIHDATVIPAIALVLFAPNSYIASNRKRIVIDRWIHFTAIEFHAVLLLRLNYLIKAYLKAKVEYPTRDMSLNQRVIISALQSLISRTGVK